ncbi:hypothetical protein AVEN_9660-1 [Araneus ventricosus]|uniref:Tc1-like transposase DDE domain-containing protein n=1 Tax=Araneus ventricosus TaxID=182803 RepID=A0A4Y2S0W4_ARAVE|nr:hypothetical protein AVEN_9660-1 [Araneus ventricosus]
MECLGREYSISPGTILFGNGFKTFWTIAVTNWPPKSPDMTPSEHTWDEIGRVIRTQDPPQSRNYERLSKQLGREFFLTTSAD